MVGTLRRAPGCKETQSNPVVRNMCWGQAVPGSFHQQRNTCAAAANTLKGANHMLVWFWILWLHVLKADPGLGAFHWVIWAKKPQLCNIVFGAHSVFGLDWVALVGKEGERVLNGRLPSPWVLLFKPIVYCEHKLYPDSRHVCCEQEPYPAWGSRQQVKDRPLVSISKLAITDFASNSE